MNQPKFDFTEEPLFLICYENAGVRLYPTDPDPMCWPTFLVSKSTMEDMVDGAISRIPGAPYTVEFFR